MNGRRGGFLLITVLLLLAMLLVLCGAYLRSQAHFYRASRQASWRAGARQLALSGLEDVRVKLTKDWKFPPLNESLTEFSYVEKLSDDTGRLVGTYRIRLSSQRATSPFEILYVQSEGLLGPPEQPLARHTVTALWDMRPLRRDPSKQPNPFYFQWVQVRDRDWRLPES